MNVEPTQENLRDVYTCYDDQLTGRVLELLEEAGIDALLRDRSSSTFPLSVGTQARQTIAVTDANVAPARLCIAAAIEDGVLTADGELLAD